MSKISGRHRRPIAHGSLTAGEVADLLADALEWPRARPFRVVSGDKAHPVSSVALCSDETAIANVADADAAILLATQPNGAVGRTGRRGYDPVFGDDSDVSSWSRLERVVFEGALPLAGGSGGVDEQLAIIAGLAADGIVPVRPVSRDEVKFIGFVPESDFEATRSAVFQAGGGALGDYENCSWSTEGVGTFQGGDESNPTVGSPNEFTQAAEIRFEVLVPRHLSQAVALAFVAAHSYEEPAYEIVPLVTPATVGFGRMGTLTSTVSLEAFANQLAAMGPASVAHTCSSSVSTIALHAGDLRNILGEVLMAQVDTVVVSQATVAERELLQERSISLIVIDSRAAISAAGHSIAATLSKRSGVAVIHSTALAFPDSFPQGEASTITADPSEPKSQPDASQAVAGLKYRMHFDGGSRGNPGPASYGWVIYGPDGDEFAADGVKVGRATNNVAEWNGMLRGIEAAIQMGITDLDIRGDSELIVKQATGVYRVKHQDLKPLAAQVAELLKQLNSYSIEHVYRDENSRADELANEAMDGLR